MGFISLTIRLNGGNQIVRFTLLKRNTFLVAAKTILKERLFAEKVVFFEKPQKTNSIVFASGQRVNIKLKRELVFYLALRAWRHRALRA
jgi:hypothetical protein